MKKNSSFSPPGSKTSTNFRHEIPHSENTPKELRSTQPASDPTLAGGLKKGSRSPADPSPKDPNSNKETDTYDPYPRSSTLTSPSPPFSTSKGRQIERNSRTENRTEPSGPSYQDMQVSRASKDSTPWQPIQPKRAEKVLKLRAESLASSDNNQNKKVPDSERVNHLRHHRSMDASIEKLRDDPSLTLPKRPFPPGVNRNPVESLPLLQRPGPEVRINSINREEIAIALLKHGSERKVHLKGADLASAIEKLVKQRNITTDEALRVINNATFTGGWDKPPVSSDTSKNKGQEGPTKRLVIGRATSLVNNINWDPETKLRTEKRGPEPEGRESYSDPVYNPEGKLITHESTAGRGVRYDIVDDDHLPSSRNHDGTLHYNASGQELRTLRGFTNPIPYSQESEKAEEDRARKDRLRDLAVGAKKKAREMFPILKKLDKKASKPLPKPK